MASSVYSEVTAVSTSGFERDRVLDKLKVAADNLPYTFQDIKISHNDFAISDVYNDSIRKLYSNYLYLIANAEITTSTSPTTATFGAFQFLSGGTNNTTLSTAVTSVDTLYTYQMESTNSLSSTNETHIAKKTYSNDSSEYFIYFNYSPDQSVIFDSKTDLSSPNLLLSGNFVEFNKAFKFGNVVSVETIDNLLFVLDKELNTAFKFDITGLVTRDPALRRTGVLDADHPGRYLLKTIGGVGTSQTKNKLKDPTCLSVHKDRVYILDNGNHSLKVFDLDFNFIQEVNSPSKFNNINNGKLVSIVVDERSDTNNSPHGYILTNKGKILEYDVLKNTISEPHTPFDIYDTRLQALTGFNEDVNFKKIVNSKSSKNILYISNNRNIFKFYKTNLNLPITVLDFSAAKFSSGGTTEGEKANANMILSFDSTLHQDADYLAVTTTPFSAHEGDGNPLSAVKYPTFTYIFGDQDKPTKLYNESFYTNYFSLSDILVLPQEVVSNITFNKTTQKLIYNHFSLFENLNKKVYSYFNITDGTLIVPTLCTVNYKGFDKPSKFTIDDNFYIGVNEPILTDVINRPLELLYDQQVQLFDLIKEESLNSNPPSSRDALLPGKIENATNVLSLNTTVSTITAGDRFDIQISRENILGLNSNCTFYYHTTLGTALSTNIDPYIPVADKSHATITKNESSITIPVDALKFFSSSPVKDRKTFSFIIEQRTNCIVDPDKQTFTGTIEPTGNMYTISVSATDLTILEGQEGQVGIIRTNSDNDYGEESICNIELQPTPSSEGGTLSSSDYTPNVGLSTEYAYVSGAYMDFPPNPNTTTTGQKSAAEISSTSTLHFTKGVSAIVFNLSAVKDYSQNFNTTLKYKISNPSAGSSIGTSVGLIRINDEVKTINLFLSSISASYTTGTTNMLSCVNLWEALSASTASTNTNAFSTVSATNPISATFTVQSPLSVFSVSTVSGALQIDAPEDSFVYANNAIRFIIDEGTTVVGKGGRGGHGMVWLSGSDSEYSTGHTWDDTYGSDLSASDYAHYGEDGGPAIGDFNNYFNQFMVINHAGNAGDGTGVFGGAGGGGGGLLGISATNMFYISALSGGCGGGGGGGIHSLNVGDRGQAAVDDSTVEGVFTSSPTSASIYLNHGNVGNSNGSGGGGGGFNNFGSYPSVGYLGPGDIDISNYPGMTGLSGGNIGYPGQGDTSTAFTVGAGGTLNSVDDFWKLRTGGQAGRIIDTFVEVVTTGSTGMFVGTGGTIIGNV